MASTTTPAPARIKTAKEQILDNALAELGHDVDLLGYVSARWPGEWETIAREVSAETGILVTAAALRRWFGHLMPIESAP